MTRSGRHARIAAVAVVLMAIVTACGDPRALTQEEIAGVLVTTGELGEAGWTAATIGEAAPEAGPGDVSDLLRGSTGVPESCREALVAFSPGSNATAFATVTFAQPAEGPLGARELVVTLTGHDNDPPRPPDPENSARACPSFDLSAQGQSLHVALRATSYGVPGATGLGLDLTTGTERMAFDLVRVVRGRNLVTASLTGKDAETTTALLGRVVARQADKVGEAAG